MKHIFKLNNFTILYNKEELIKNLYIFNIGEDNSSFVEIHKELLNESNTLNINTVNIKENVNEIISLRNINRIIIVEKIEKCNYVLNKIVNILHKEKLHLIEVYILDITFEQSNSNYRKWEIDNISNVNNIFKSIDIKYCNICRKPKSNLNSNKSLHYESIMCKVCTMNNATFISLPCRHLLYCKNCIDVLYNDLETCIICRSPVFTYMDIII